MRGDTLFNLICGPTKRGYGVPVMLTNAKSGCGGGGGGPFQGGGFGGFLTGGGGTGFEGGGGTGGGVYVAPVHSDSKSPCRLCPLATIAAALGCILPISSDIFKNPSTAFETDPNLQAVLDGLENLSDAAETIGQLTGGGEGKTALASQRAPTVVKPEEIDVGKILEVTQNILEGLEKAGEVSAKRWITPVKILSCAYDIATACDGLPALARVGAHQTGTHRTLTQVSFPAGKSSAGVSQPELAPLIKYSERLQTTVDVQAYIFGDEIWLHDESAAGPEWLRAFLPRTEAASAEGFSISASERTELLAVPLPATVNSALANKFLDRWNRTVTYWNAKRFNLADVPAGESTDFIALDVLHSKLTAAVEVIRLTQGEGFTSISAALDSARQDLIRYLESQLLGTGLTLANLGFDLPRTALQSAKHSVEGEICATIRLRIEQQAVITRDAFDATLEVSNSTAGPLEEVFVELEMLNQVGETTTGLFGIRPPTLSGLTGVDGTGVIAANSTGKASWILVPTSEAAPDGPTLMVVGGTLRYRQQGTLITIPLAPATITVLPNASLKVKYFHDRDVFSDDPFTDEIEPAIPFSLGVLIQNVGKGAARNVRITSAQPQIIENEKGLLIDFEIIATEVAGQNLSPSLTADFGNIGPGEVAEGRWLLRSSLQGLFTEYKASFEHLDSLGDKRLSLIESVEIHELNHVVRAGGTFEDGKLDFLVNDVPDQQDLPDTLYLSDGRIEPVTLATQSSVDAPPSSGDLEVKLTAAWPGGWAYLRIPDPANGQFPLTRVRRDDGSELPLDFNVWTTDRTFVGNGRRPVGENTLHLLDHNSAGSYTLIYSEPRSLDQTAPISKVEALPPSSFVSIPVRWSGRDESGGSGIEFFDIFVSANGGPFHPWLRKTTLTGALYDGAQNERYAFYSVATDKAGNTEAAHTSPDAQTAVALANTAPKLTAPNTQTINEGQTLNVTMEATDSDVPANALTFSLDGGAPLGAIIDPATGVLTWATGEGNGPSTNKITVRVSDNGVPSLSAMAQLMVIVNEVNQAPEIATLTDRAINEGTRLTFSATSSDPDLPSNALAFRLAAGAPTGATITPAGVFTWTPTALQGPSTNKIDVVVTDNGSPNLSTTTTFTVIVRDALGDFTLGIGATNVLAGQQGLVPIQLSSEVDLTRLSFLLEAPSTHVGNLILKPLIPEIALASLHELTPGQFRIDIRCAAGQVLQGSRAAAQLSFDADNSGESARAELRISQIEGERANGTRLTKARARAGTVVIIGKQPVLEAAAGPAPALILYGRPGASFAIESTTELGERPAWTTLTRVPQTGTFQTIANLPKVATPIFYRAVEFVAQPARVDLNPSPGRPASLLLYGQVGRTYEVELLDDLSARGAWRSRGTVSLTNSFQFIELPNLPDSSGFYRVRER